MEIWEERYTDEKYGLEPPVSFRHFSRLLMKSDRNLRKFAEELVYEQIADEKKRAVMKGEKYKKPTEKQIQQGLKKSIVQLQPIQPNTNTKYASMLMIIILKNYILKAKKKRLLNGNLSS